MSDMTKQAQIFDKILKKEENKLCADCRRKSPSWASLNLGVLICMKCSDNKIANEYWEYKLKDLNYEKLQNDDYKLQDLIKDKYERKKFCDQKKTDPMTLIIKGKSPKKDDDSFRDVEEDDVNSSDEDRSTKRKNKHDKGFKLNSVSNESNYKNNKNTIHQEPLFQINNTNNNLISFDAQENKNIHHINNNPNNNTINPDNKFNFINKNNQNYILNNPINNLFSLNQNNYNGNVDLMDLKAGDKIVDEKLKNISDNLDQIYKNPNNNNGNTNFNLQNNNSNNKQNDLFNALNPQFNANKNMNMRYPNMNHQPVNVQNNFYNNTNNNFNQSNQNNNYNINQNNNNYANGMNLSFNNVHGIGNSGFNGGYGANYAANSYMNMNQHMNNNRNLNNNFNNTGFLTPNDIYTKKDDNNFKFNNYSNGNFSQSNINFIEISEMKPKKNEDPFSNLISFK